MPSIGKDLAAIRSHLGYSIEDIQQATKIPLTTLKSIEDGSIFEQTDEIKAYVRSFVRSYGRAIKLNDELLVEALDQEEIGSYNHLLLGNFPQLQPKQTKKDKPSPEESKQDKEEKSDSGKSPEKKEPKHTESPSEESKPPKPAAKESAPKPSETNSSELKDPPGIRNVDWADMGKRFTSEKKKAPVWLTATVVITIILFGSIYLMVSNGLFSSDELEQAESIQETPSQFDGETGSDLSLNLTDEPQESEAVAAELDEILYLTLYAATGRLDPVRVYSDEKPRIDPYWMNQGQAFNFEFRDTIRVRGQYSRMLLFLNGHLIEDPRQEYFNSSENAIEFTRDIFENDPKWATPRDLELPENVTPPDSLIDRPSF